MPESSRYGEVDNKQLGQLPLKTQSSRREISVAFKFNSWNMGITKRKNKYDCGARKFLPSNFILRTVIIRNSCQGPSVRRSSKQQVSPSLQGFFALGSITPSLLTVKGLELDKMFSIFLLQLPVFVQILQLLGNAQLLLAVFSNRSINTTNVTEQQLSGCQRLLE